MTVRPLATLGRRLQRNKAMVAIARELCDIIEGSQDSLRVTRDASVLRGHDLPLPCAL